MTIRKTTAKLLAGCAAIGSMSIPTTASAGGTQPFIGQLMYTGANFCPVGYMNANGALISIAQNTALFSILGTTYGGDGVTTFALPDHRGRVGIHVGAGPGLAEYQLGEVAGTETVTLLSTQMPLHTHPFTVTTPIRFRTSSQAPNTNIPNGSLATYPTNFKRYVKPAGTEAGLVVDADFEVGLSGGSQPHDNIAPYLAMTTCVAVEGIFPSRN